VFEPFLKVWVGHDMAMAAYPIGQIVLVGIWANSLTALYYSFYQAAGRPRVVSLTLLAQVVPYLAMLWIGLRFWGLEGAAWAGALRAFAILLPMFFAQHPSRATRQICVIAVVSLLLGYGLARFVHDSPTPCLAGALVILCGLSAASLAVLKRDFPANFARFKLRST
jgi:O-antigen/teichoic acid export membrane protein